LRANIKSFRRSLVPQIGYEIKRELSVKYLGPQQPLFPLDSSTSHSASGPFRIKISGFSRYNDSLHSLPILEIIKIVVVSDFIAESYDIGNLPILSVQCIGHADTDFQRGRKFEQDISERRARQVAKFLKSEVDWRTFSNRLFRTDPNLPTPANIAYHPAGVGASQPDEENVKRHKSPQNMTEHDRKLNRRVEIILEPGSTPISSIAPRIDVLLELQKEIRRMMQAAGAPTPAPQLPILPKLSELDKYLPKPKPDELKQFRKRIKDALKNIDADTVIGVLHDALINDPSTGGWTDSVRQLVDEIEKKRRDGDKKWWLDDDDD